MDENDTYDVSSTPRGSMEAYLGDVSRYDVMTRDEEKDQAVHIAACRNNYWRALLSYPPYVGPIVGVIKQQLPDAEIDGSLLDDAEVAARALRDRQTRRNRDRYEKMTQCLSEVMSYADPDNLAADLVAADLELLDAGCAEGLNMDVRLPPTGSKPFHVYVQQVRTSAAALRGARNRFVKANLRLVLTMAHRYNHGLLPLPDLIQEGNLGLLKAVDRFDHRKGFRFSTYATWWIRHAISRATANRGRTVRVPAHMASQFHQLRKARRQLEGKLGRKPTLDELAETLNVSLDKIERIEQALRGRPISLDAPVGDPSDQRSVMEMLPDDESDSAAEQLEHEDERQMLHRAMEILSPLEVDILRKRFGLAEDGREHTLKEVGSLYSLSRERIRQLQERAMAKIRAELVRNDLRSA